MNKTRRQLTFAPALLATLTALPARAQRFPTRAVHLVVPFPPGGSTDVAARSLAERISRDLEQPVVVENKPGAGTTIAAALVAAAPPDGYTLYITGTLTHGAAAALYKKLTYDPVKSFVPVGLVTRSPFILVVNSASKLRSVQDLLVAARAQPGAVSYASSGNGAAPHLITEMLGRSAGVKFLHAPFKGVGPALAALLANDVQFTVADIGAVPHIQGGRLRALSVLSARPSPLVPNVPGLAQAGVRDIDLAANLGILAPAGTPADVVARLNASINKALTDPDFKARLTGLGLEPSPGTPEEFGRTLAVDAQKYADIVREVGITVD